MRIEYDRLRIYEKAILAALLIVLFFRVFLNGGMQQWEYYNYLLHKDSYTCVNATICSESVHSIETIFLRGSFGTIIEKNIEYEMGEKIYRGITKTYDDYESNDNIIIAVNNNNPQKVIRCIPYNKEKMKDNIFPILMRIGICICIFFIVNRLVLQWRKHRDSKANINLIQQQIQKQEVEEHLYERKKEYILSCMKDIEEIEYKKEMTGQLECPINEDFIWCLKNLAGTYVADGILMLGINENNEYEFVDETMKLRQQGLPKQYYVIAKVDNNYLCGWSDTHRLYCFSYVLGITNTSYASIYDYIIEQIDKG